MSMIPPRFNRRIVGALAIAPLFLVVVGCVAAVVVFGVTGMTDDAVGGSGIVLALQMVLFLGIPLSYAACFAVGFPTHLVLHHLQWTSLKAYVTAGAISTGLPMLWLLWNEGWANAGIVSWFAAGLIGILLYFVLMLAPVFSLPLKLNDPSAATSFYGLGVVLLTYASAGLTDLMFGYQYHTMLFVVLCAIVTGYCRRSPAGPPP